MAGVIGLHPRCTLLHDGPQQDAIRNDTVTTARTATAPLLTTEPTTTAATKTIAATAPSPSLLYHYPEDSSGKKQSSSSTTIFTCILCDYDNGMQLPYLGRPVEKLDVVRALRPPGVHGATSVTRVPRNN